MDMFLSHSSQINTTQPTEDWTTVYSAVRWIQMSMALLSILGSGSIIFYTVLQRHVRTSEVQPLFLLCLTDLLLAVSWLSGALLFSSSCDSHATCYNLHTVEQTLFMASFFYTLHYVWVLYTGLKEKYYCRQNGFPAQANPCSQLAAVMSCVLPLVLTVPVFITGNASHCYVNFTQPYRCLLLHTGALYLTSQESEILMACKIISDYTITTFLITFFFTLTGIVVLMVKARSLYKRCVTSHGFFADRQWATLRVLEQRMILYPSAFFFCWGPAIFLATMMLIKPEEVEGRVGVILYILQAFTSGSQGLLNCLVYGWTQQNFRTLSSSTVRDADTQTPLLRSQKQTYNTLWSSSTDMQHV
ncbi:transmembrane protein 116 isoform X1 [Ictalurus punctatus]|uniref:Transmembrane protein 116 isoform X1 n=2 Tax=Ictalurus punctatus TaxID=7998 RepID=A0A2D0PSG5_ICTPU|nr:transmembrane protein 116 isoform X1 [Ictalurus punctatus]